MPSAEKPLPLSPSVFSPERSHFATTSPPVPPAPSIGLAKLFNQNATEPAEKGEVDEESSELTTEYHEEIDKEGKHAQVEVKPPANAGQLVPLQRSSSLEDREIKSTLIRLILASQRMKGVVAPLDQKCPSLTMMKLPSAKISKSAKQFLPTGLDKATKKYPTRPVRLPLMLHHRPFLSCPLSSSS